MRLREKLAGISRWDYYSLVIILFAITIQLLKWDLLPIFVDVYYHLLTAAGFNEAGGWVHSCFWEYAPVGRPQLYPPLLHIIILFFLKLGIPFLVVGKLIQFAIYPLLLFTIWYVIRVIFDKRQAFFTTVLIFAPYSFYLTAISTSAASLSLIFCLLSLLFFEREKIITSALFLGIAFYTHGYTSWIFLIVFIFYGILNRKKVALSLKVVLIALCFASPFIIFQFLHRDYFLFQRNIVENYYIELNLFDWALFLLGLITCLKNKGKHYMLVALFLSSTIFLLSGPVFRYLSFYGIMSIVFMNAVFLNNFYNSLNKKRKVIYLGAIFGFCFIFSPTLNIDLSERRMSRVPKEVFSENEKLVFKKGAIVTLDYLDSNLVNFILYCAKADVRGNEVSIYFPRLFREIIDVVVTNTEEDDIIYSNLPPLGGVMSLLSQRSTSSAMLSEMKPYSIFDQIFVSKLIVWYKDPYDIEKEPFSLVENYHLKKIADTKLAFIYGNPKCSFKKQALSATISYKILFVLMFLVFILIVWSAKFGIDK